MAALQCPKCELKFSWHTELDQHCRDDHPQFRHEYHAAHDAEPGPTFLDHKVRSSEVP